MKILESKSTDTCGHYWIIEHRGRFYELDLYVRDDRSAYRLWRAPKGAKCDEYLHNLERVLKPDARMMAAFIAMARLSV